MNIHFVGIGGIGLSALAQYFLSKKHKVTGSDLVNSEIIALLKRKGVKVFLGKHSPKNISQETDLIICTPAVTEDNPEIQEGKRLKIKIKTYPEALGSITKKHFTIAVSGTHGKSTTSAMIALSLAKSNFNPTAILGTKLKEFNNSNFRSGKSNYLVIEADEYKRSFLNYSPKILVLTNIEEDHLDYYKDLNDILDAFNQYLKNITKGGYLVINEDDPNIEKLIKKQKDKLQFKIKKYSLKQKESQEIRSILKVPGDHNVLNALAAMESLRIIGLKDEEIFKALSFYNGSWRRFEVFNLKKLILISDYAHHPTEIEKTLKAAREKYPDKKIRCIFQPHQYERTSRLFKDFVRVLKNAPVDELILCEIYDVAGRESEITKKTTNSKKIKDAINKSFIKYKKTLKEAEDYTLKTSKKGDVLIVMGAGDIYNLFLKLKKSFV